MRNTILTAMILMLMPEMASAQFYTITKEAEIKQIRANDNANNIDIKDNTARTEPNKELEGTLKLNLILEQTSVYAPEKWTVKRPKNSSELKQTSFSLN